VIGYIFTSWSLRAANVWMATLPH